MPDEKAADPNSDPKQREQQEKQVSAVEEKPAGTKKAYLKTINITIEDEGDDEEDSEVIWFELDDFENAKFDSSFVTAQASLESLGAWLSNSKAASQDGEKGTASNDATAGGAGGSATTGATSDVLTPNFTSRNQLLNFLHQQKRIFWGEEVPCSTTSWSLESSNPNNCILTMGVNPLITIRPVNRNDTIKDDILITSSASTSVAQSSRVLKLGQLKNYFRLSEPETSDYNQIRFNYKYYLSLLDPSMPRLTNCGHYYRMRYAVYVMAKPGTGFRSMNQSNWRNSSFVDASSRGQRQQQQQPQQQQSRCAQPQQQQTKQQQQPQQQHHLIHIGEMHLYTIFPKNNRLDAAAPRDKTTGTTVAGSDYIHYENISFFLNQTPLTKSDLSTLQMTESDLNQLTINFRRYLKHLNSIIVSVKTATLNFHLDQGNFNSTFLLEQLKYPITSEQFANTDRLCEQFLRNQAEMFARYHQFHHGSTTSSSGDLLSKCATNTSLNNATNSTNASSASSSSASATKDTHNSDLFIANLLRLSSNISNESN